MNNGTITLYVSMIVLVEYDEISDDMRIGIEMDASIGVGIMHIATEAVAII